MSHGDPAPLSWLQAAWLILRKDVAIELKTRELTTSTGLFAVLVVVLTSLAFYLDRGTARALAPGVLWVAITFSGILAVSRAWAREREQDSFRGLLLSPLPRSAIYSGKVAALCLFLTAVQLVLVPLVALLFHTDLSGVLFPLLAILALGTLGFVATATLFGLLTVRTGARDLLLSVVVFPLTAPVLLAAVVATRELISDAPMSEVYAWLRILVAADIIFVAAGLALFEPLALD